MALIHDAVQLFARALRRLDLPAVDIRQLDCESQNNWGHGASLINFMKDVSITTESTEKLIVPQPVRKLDTFHGTEMS
jgi:hypothetical protein